MESGSQWTGPIPNPAASGGGAVADAAAPTPMDADAGTAASVGGRYAGKGPLGQPGEKAKKTKERSANKKKIQSSRSSLTDSLEKATISNDIPIGSANLSSQECDDVFSPPVGPSGGSGNASGAVESADFPAEYKIIRTTKAAKLAPARLGGLFGLSRMDTGVRLGYGEGGLAVPGDARTFLAQNYHCAGQGINVSFSVKKPSATGDDDHTCLACPTPHSHVGRRNEGRPVVIVVAGQSFPAVLPAAEGDCVIVVRVEDGSLGELENVFSDRFRAFLKPHGSLTPGSVILFGSISHLRSCGLQDYIDQLVKIHVSLCASVGAGVDVIPLVCVPMHGLESGSLIRNLMDLDSWLLSVQGGGRTALPKTRENFWAAVTVGVRTPPAALDSQTLMLPVGFRNHRKHPVVSDPYDGHIPTSIPPVNEQIERRIVTALLLELNDVYGLNLDISPDFNRNPNHNTGNGQGRVILVGGSHMARLAEALQLGGAETRFVGAPGWVATRAGLADAAAQIQNLKVTGEDSVVLDLWSNSAYMGTDEFGLPVRAAKASNDGKYHIVGDLQAAPKTVFEKIMQDSVAVLDAARGSKVVLVIPIPRYILNKCCTAAGHVANFGQESFSSEVYRAMEMAEQAIAACSAASDSVTTGVIEVFSCADLDLAEVCTTGGESIWGSTDPVHLSQPAYMELADSIVRSTDSEQGERPRKRARLESVVPPATRGARGVQGRVRPPLWVSGMAPRLPTRPGRGRAWPRGQTRGLWRPRGRGGSGGRIYSYRGRGYRGRGFRGY